MRPWDDAGGVRNIERNPRARLKLRDGLRARWCSGSVHLLTDDDPRERQRAGHAHAADRENHRAQLS